MKNGKLPTWFVMKWLSVNWHHTAKAPESEDFWPCEASTDGQHMDFVTLWPHKAEHGVPPNRNGWTIYREDGKPVRFKRKPKMEHVGELNSGESLTAEDVVGISLLKFADMDERFDVYVRQKKGRK